VGHFANSEREPLETLLGIRRAQGEYNFESQYLQSPTPVAGHLVKRQWLRFYEPKGDVPEFERTVQSWDTANKASELSDYSVCTTWGIDGTDFYLPDVFRQKLNFPDLKRQCLELKRKFKAHTVIIEDKASGTQLIQDLQRAFVPGIHPYKPPPDADKQVRLHMQTTFFENGRVYLPLGAPWLDDYINELTGFPGTKYDDQVDSTTQALAYLREPDEMATWGKLGRGLVVRR
jgi:predicted phage terminase large subunit-like protein